LDYKEGRSFVNQVREVLRGTFFVCPALHDLDRFVERGTASLDEAGWFKVGLAPCHWRDLLQCVRLP
jgi:hypothetical protein